MDVRVVDNPKEQRYELWLGATRAGFIQYRSEPGTILLVHTEVEPAFEGQGLGARLVAGALDEGRQVFLLAEVNTASMVPLWVSAASLNLA